MSKRYCVQTEWSYSGHQSMWYERCYIFPSSSDYEEMDGANMLGRNEGFEFNIYNSLEEAIVNAHFNPKHILFEGLEEKELKEKDNILTNYIWDQYKGLVIKDV